MAIEQLANNVRSTATASIIWKRRNGQPITTATAVYTAAERIGRDEIIRLIRPISEGPVALHISDYYQTLDTKGRLSFVEAMGLVVASVVRSRLHFFSPETAPWETREFIGDLNQVLIGTPVNLREDDIYHGLDETQKAMVVSDKLTTAVIENYLFRNPGKDKKVFFDSPASLSVLNPVIFLLKHMGEPFIHGTIEASRVIDNCIREIEGSIQDG